MTALAMAPYAGVLVAAAVEGEVVFVAASALVATGVLQPAAVALAGACGAALGDQFFYFALRAGASRWLTRPADDRPRAGLLDWVRRHQTLAAFSVRFTPGLRLTITALCATAGVGPWRFCSVNAVSSLIWAVTVMSAVAYGGPRLLSLAGLGPQLSAAMVALLVLAAMAALAPLLQRAWAAAPRFGGGTVAVEP